jgi:hypothetical protein
MSINVGVSDLMALRYEEYVSEILRTVLTGVPNGGEIEDSEQLRDVLNGFEYFLPEVLREIHPEWNDGLDGFLLYVARKTGDQEAEFVGHCILITDQTTTPIHIRLQLARDLDEVSWLELKLGEKGETGMVRRPYSYPPSLKRVAALADGIDAIDWFYKVGFGERRT